MQPQYWRFFPSNHRLFLSGVGNLQKRVKYYSRAVQTIMLISNSKKFYENFIHKPSLVLSKMSSSF